MKSHKRAMTAEPHVVRYVLLALALGAIVTLWLGSARVSAIDRQPETQQRGTLPPPPTPRPPTPQPTPTPRPGRSDSNGGQSSSPTATPTTPAAATSALTTQPVASLVFSGTINAPILNVRQGPGTNFPVIGRLNNGTEVQILGQNAGGAWLNICCLPDSQRQGWVSATYVTPAYTAEQAAALPVLDNGSAQPGTSSPPAVAATNALTGVVSAISLNVRAEPSTAGALLGRLPSNATVSLLGRNAAGDWWLVCCTPGVEGNGWVAAEYITPGANREQLAALPVTTGRTTPAVAVLAASTVTSTIIVPEPVAAVTTTLALTVEQQPVLAIQGDEIVLSFALTNTGDVTATLAELSFEMTPGLSFVSASANDGGETSQEETERSTEVVLITWPALASGAATTARITVAVADDLADGAVIDGYVVAQAGNAASTFVPILVAMPPADPPDFQ